MIVTPGSIGWLITGSLYGQFAFISLWDYFKLLPFLWLVAYLPVATRRVYGGSRLATAFKWLVLMTAHLLVVATSTVIAELIGIMSRS